MIEIYNEQVRDLLNPKPTVLHTRWNAKSGFFVEDLLIVNCFSADEMLETLHNGLKNRQLGESYINKDSSRSHMIVTWDIFYD